MVDEVEFDIMDIEDLERSYIEDYQFMNDEAFFRQERIEKHRDSEWCCDDEE